ncbi:MAG: hypothetical protein NTX42_01285 [Methanothrix sp.]|nr:hypothetical protein [Methanothrix sp.]
MRFEESCENYAINAADDGFETDPVISAGKEKAEIVEKVNELRSQRWGFCSLAPDNGSAKIVICDKIAFETSVNNELSEMQNLARLNSIFNKLNPLFHEVQLKYPALISPTLSGIEHMRSESIHKINTFMSRVKNEVAYRSGLQSKGQTLDQVLANPQFKKFKEDHEKYILAEEAKIKQLDFYSNQVKSIIQGDE